MLNIKKISTRGIATLPAVMVLAILTLVVAVGVTSLSVTESFISEGSTQSSSALFYAEAGARDALTKIARNKSYTCTATDCYDIEFVSGGCAGTLNGCAKVSVSAGTGSTATPKIITAKGFSKTSTRILQVSVVFDGGTVTNGEITGATWTELTN